MDSRKLVLKQTGSVALGELILCSVMLGVFAALGRFSVIVLCSGIAGCLIVVANFFFMAVSVNSAADKAADGDAGRGKTMVQTSSVLRLLCMGAALVLCIKLGADVLALVLPLAFLRPVLMLTEFFGKKGD